ncbi:hypothetical protein M513_11593 [Trichuris suis]|uniref:Uncharacterized protein n=1 Tax=Trichuris suis TaxID=68888 RepID=A0A085LRF3_9BILA|nr:hypothetical protein M513_11593 [Trichuris suis]
MSRKRCMKSESVVIEGQVGTGAGVRSGDELLGKLDTEETVSVGQRHGGSWAQPPHTLSASMDIEVWLGRLDDYLSANAVPEVHWSTVLKSLVDDKIYRSITALGRNCSDDQITSHLRERFGCGEFFFTQRLQFSRRMKDQRSLLMTSWKIYDA